MELHRAALLPYPQAEVFALINDIEKYPQFLPYCTSAEVLHEDASEVLGRLVLAAGRFNETLTTRNCLRPPSHVRLELVEGSLRNFEGYWQVTKLEDASGELGCKVELHLSFELTGALKLASRALRRPIAKATDKVFQGFCDQAAAVCTNGD